MIYRNINFWWLCDLLRILCVNLHLCLCSQFWISSSLSEVLSLNLIFNFREVDNVVGKQLWWVGYWWVNTVLVWGTKKEVCFQYTEMNRHDWWSHSEQRWKKNWRAFTISTYSDQQDVTRVLWRYDSFSITTKYQLDVFGVVIAMRLSTTKVDVKATLHLLLSV